MIFEDWGLLDYREAWDRQKKIFTELQNNNELSEHIVFVEHPAVYTIGFHGNPSNVLASEDRLKMLGAECIRIERGGDVTYHGPGQLVVYPIINLHRHHLGVKKFIETLEDAVIDLLHEYNIIATCNKDAIGVWLDWDTPHARKICAIGVKISHGVSMHGFALNVNTDLSAFSLINPCGFIDKGVTSIAKEVGREVDMNVLKRRLRMILLEKFSL